MSYAAPDEKTFVTLSARGSWLVRDLVFSDLMQTEAATARGKERNDSSITPANYRSRHLAPTKLAVAPAMSYKLFRYARTNTCSRAAFGWRAIRC